MNRELPKSKMSTEERAERRIAIGKAASEKVAKSEQLNFRISEQTIGELQDLAFKKGMPVGTMIRDWVHERLALEKIGKSDDSAKALQILGEIHGKLNALFHSGAERYTDPTSQNIWQGMVEPRRNQPLTILETCTSDQLEHLKASEHVLNDQLTVIRHRLQEIEGCSPTK